MNGVIEWVIFLSLSAIAVTAAASMILTMSMYRAGLALMASFVALAGLFILLNADLLAAIQVMMNVGGMLVMVLFMVMMMMDPGGEMMWGMKQDMHIPGPAAFSMTMPRGKPPEEDTAGDKKQQDTSTITDWTCLMHAEISQGDAGTCPKCGMALLPRAQMANGDTSQAPASHEYTCPMHKELQQDQPGTCPTCGMTLIPATGQQTRDQTASAHIYTCPMHPEVRENQHGKCPQCGMTLIPATNSMQEQASDGQHALLMSMEHAHNDESVHSSDQEMSMRGMAMGKRNGHEMQLSGGKMDKHAGMTPRQYYDMMVGMAMSTAQLPWAIVLGAIAALLLVILVIQTPWTLAPGGPTQDATTMVGELLLSRYMIGFEGAAFLILAGLGMRLPLTAAVLAICLLSLAGFPPFGGFIGKTYLFGAALGAGWTWLAIVMLANVAVSLFYYVRVLEPMYLRSSPDKPLQMEPLALRFVLLVLGLGTLLSGVLPQVWVLLATHAASLLGAMIPH